jgi:hypothetical protein
MFTDILGLGFQILAGWCVVSIVIAAPLCWLISRGKVDGHRRQHGASDRDADRLGRLSVGAEINNIDHSTSV